MKHSRETVTHCQKVAGAINTYSFSANNHTGVVTRCPIEVKMKTSRKEDFWHGKIKYEDYEEEIEDPADMEHIIRNGSTQNQANLNAQITYLNANIKYMLQETVSIFPFLISFTLHY